jgi:hypothetical protein
MVIGNNYSISYENAIGTTSWIVFTKSSLLGQDEEGVKSVLVQIALILGQFNLPLRGTLSISYLTIEIQQKKGGLSSPMMFGIFMEINT